MIVVFDLDDTLFKEIDFLKSAYKEIAARCNVPLEFMMQCYYEGNDVFQATINAYHLPATKYQLLCLYRNHVPAINLDTATESALLSIKQQGNTLGIITDGRSITQRNKIKALRLHRYVNDDDIIISEEFGHCKPKDAVYQYFENRYKGKTFAYVGDNVAKDFVTANRRGWRTICLLNDGRNIHDNSFCDFPAEYQPQLCIKSLTELNKLLTK